MHSPSHCLNPLLPSKKIISYNLRNNDNSYVLLQCKLDVFIFYILSVYFLTVVFLLCNWQLYLLLVYVFFTHVRCLISIKYDDDDRAILIQQFHLYPSVCLHVCSPVCSAEILLKHNQYCILSKENFFFDANAFDEIPMAVALANLRYINALNNNNNNVVIFKWQTQLRSICVILVLDMRVCVCAWCCRAQVCCRQLDLGLH